MYTFSLVLLQVDLWRSLALRRIFWRFSELGITTLCNLGLSGLDLPSRSTESISVTMPSSSEMSVLTFAVSLSDSGIPEMIMLFFIACNALASFTSSFTSSLMIFLRSGAGPAGDDFHGVCCFAAVISAFSSFLRVISGLLSVVSVLKSERTLVLTLEIRVISSELVFSQVASLVRVL